MKSQVQSGGPGRWADRYPVVVRNGTSEQIPPYAIVQVGGASAFGTNTIYTVVKPNGTAGAKYLINSPGAIGVGQSPGIATDQYPSNALITGTPTLNQEIGPTAGSWGLSVNVKGFIYLGGLAGGVGRVASTTAGDDFPLVKIINLSGVPRLFGSIYGYGISVDPGTKNRIPTFQSAAPTAGKPFCVGLSDVAYTDTCDAGPVGVVEVQVNVTDAAHEYAEAITGDYDKLASASSGPARIIWRANQGIAGGGTLGLQTARVRLDPVAASEDIRGVSYQTITAATGTISGPITPGFGLARLYTAPTGPAGTPWQIQSSPVTVENWMFATVVPQKPILLRKGRTAADGSQIYCVIAEGCKEITSG